MDYFFQQIVSLIDQPVVLFFIFLLLAVTNLFFPPIPLESATLFGGFLAGTQRGSLFAIIAATTMGMFTGSMVLFWLTRRHGIATLQKTPLGKLLTENHQRKMAGWFKKFGLWAIFIGKIIPGMSLAVVIFSGLTNWSTPKTAVAIFASNLLFFAGLALTGRVMGASWKNAAHWLKNINLWAALICVLLVICVILLVRRRSKIR